MRPVSLIRRFFATLGFASASPPGREKDDRISATRPQLAPAHETSTLERQLREYEDELARLRMENEQLRQSAMTFGELAERLNQALKKARASTARALTPVPGFRERKGSEGGLP